MSGRLRFDLNNPEFQADLLGLEADQLVALFATFSKISNLSWEQVYRDKGLHWEAIHTRTGKDKTRLYTLRVTRKFRAVAYRDSDWMRCVSLHPDHDSAYN